MYQSIRCEFYDGNKPFASDEEVAFYSQFFNKDELILEPMCASGRIEGIQNTWP